MDVEALAIQVGLEPILGCLKDGDDMHIECNVYSGLEEFARLVAIAEREACAKVCSDLAKEYAVYRDHWPQSIAANECAALITKRSNYKHKGPPVGGPA